MAESVCGLILTEFVDQLPRNHREPLPSCLTNSDVLNFFQTRFDVIEATEDHDSRILPVEEEPAEGWLAAVCGLGLRLALQVLAALALLLLFGWLFDDDCSRRRGNTVRESLEPLLQWSDGPPPM